MLRWEKTAEILCLIIEGQELRNALRAEPRTRLWGYCDLSPDARAIEQFGAGLEYAGITYCRVPLDLDAPIDAPSPSLDGAGRLSGEAMGSLQGVALGIDGCPLISEWTKRVFAPMLEALGPKYASTCDCWMRTLQVYGCDVGQLLADDFQFASVEQLDVPVPLLNVQEGMTSDAGGEVQKSGGVIETVVPNASWRHCTEHCLNLAMRRSAALERAGPRVRSISCFCRGGNKHHALVRHMEFIQDPSQTPANCTPRLRQIYVDAHEQVKRHGQFHTQLGGVQASVASLGEQLDELQHVALSKIRRKSKKGTDIRWKYECEVVDDRLLDVAHLLAPAILIEYGTGETYAELKINQGTEKTPKNKTAAATLEHLVDPEFIFWATYMRLMYRLVYRPAFDSVQSSHHHSAPLLAGPDGLPVQWAASFRSAVVQPKSPNEKPKLDPVVCAPLVALLKRHRSLGGETGELARAAAADFLEQAEHIERYFAKWNSLEALSHALAREEVIAGPLPKDVCLRLEDELQFDYFEAMPRVPAAEAIKSAKLGLKLFEEADEVERIELPGTLTWLLFSPTTRDGATNPVYAEVQAFAAAEVNALSGEPFPYSCWHSLAQVLVAGGAKYAPSTSAQLESMFTGLTRQQGASKHHISQIQISFESRCVKNTTMGGLTESVLNAGWSEAKKVQAALRTKGFWTCDPGLAADRKFAQKLKEELETEGGDEDDEVSPDGQVYEVENIVRHEKTRGKGEFFYIVKWKDWDSSTNTREPEVHLICNKLLLSYWRSKKNKAQLDRVTKLQEAALGEKERRSKRRLQPQKADREGFGSGAAAAAAGAAADRPSPRGRPEQSPCKATYDRAHSALPAACCLVFDTETSGLDGCVLDIGWILADSKGKELASHSKLWRLPAGERSK